MMSPAFSTSLVSLRSTNTLIYFNFNRYVTGAHEIIEIQLSAVIISDT